MTYPRAHLVGAENGGVGDAALRESVFGPTATEFRHPRPAGDCGHPQPARSPRCRCPAADATLTPAIRRSHQRCAASAPRDRALTRPGRQAGCHDGVSEATFAVSTCLDGLCATGVPAELAMISHPHDTAAAWQIRGLNRLSAGKVCAARVSRCARMPVRVRSGSMPGCAAGSGPRASRIPVPTGPPRRAETPPAAG